MTRVLCTATALCLCLASYPNGEQLGTRAAGNERFLVTVNGLHGYIDKTGTIVITPKYTVAGEFRESRAFFGSNSRCTGFWTPQVARLFRALFGRRFFLRRHGRRLDCPDPRGGFVGRTGRFVVPPTFEEVHSFSAGLALAYQEPCKPLFIDHSGKIVIRAPGDFATAFREELSIVEVDGQCGLGGKYGYMDRSGDLTIAPRFASAAPFFEGLAAVRVGDKWGFIDRKGTLVIPPRFEHTAAGAPGPFRSGLARVYSRIPGDRQPNASAMADLQAGYINTQGEYVWSPTH